ncbi:histidine kinase [Winogradskyella sp. 4-2091]|uniref:sensor histidine kinase n=1 Tax=Winogradskyella sp. 4-2091 TaxID=3381659 RepID=UPI0038912D50
MLKYLSLLIIYGCILSLNAQQPASIHLTEKDGLPDIEFYNIIEDSKQFIWLAADKGLYRYNGRQYDYFSHPKQRGNAVFGTLEDDKGRIWCNNISGQFFYIENKRLNLFIDLGDILNGELPQFKVNKTHLIVFTGRTIYSVNLDDKKVTKAINKTFSLIGLPLEQSNNYYYTKRNYIIKTDHTFNKVDSLHIDIYDERINTSISKSANLASNGNIFLCHFLRHKKNVFYQFDILKKTLELLKVPIELESRSINQVFFKDDEIWMTTDIGIQIFKLLDNKLEFQRSLFNKVYVTKIIRDSNDNYWVTTKGEGIFIIPNINIFQYELSKDLVNINKIKNIGNNTILFGTNNGRVATIDTEKNNIKVLDISSTYRVSEIILDKVKPEAIIVKEDIALSLNIESGRLQKMYNELLYGAKSISKIETASYVLSSYKDAILLDNNFNEINKLVNKRSYTNYASKEKKDVYVSTVEGLFVFDKAFNKTEIKYKNEHILGTSITETNDNTIWVSTFKNGILGIKNKSVIVTYDESNGLLSNKTSVLQSDKNHLWIATEKGLQLLDVTKKTFKNLTRQDGIPTYRISDIEVMDNKVLFVSNIGMFGLYKDSAFKKVKNKTVYFTDFRINEQSHPIKDSYELDYDENKIGFNFNSNGFQSNVNTRYKYRLLGSDSIWKTTNELVNYVDYNSLASGDYKFQVKALPESDTIKTIEFSILKPFWKRWWFYVLSVILIGLAIYFIFVSKIEKLKRKQAEVLQKEFVNKQLVLSQLENLRSQMNPHFIFNALNSIQEYIVLNEKELASSFLIKFSRLIRIYLEHSRESEVTLNQELKALNIYLELEKNRFEDILDYSIEVSETIDISRVKVPSLFIQPYVENALKHGLLHKKDNRKLKLIFYLNNNNDILFCEIEDNGIGVEASKKLNASRRPMHKSFATSANEKRVTLLNTTRKTPIKVTITPLDLSKKTGTKVEIKIPIQSI